MLGPESLHLSSRNLTRFVAPGIARVSQRISQLVIFEEHVRRHDRRHIGDWLAVDLDGAGQSIHGHRNQNCWITVDPIALDQGGCDIFKTLTSGLMAGRTVLAVYGQTRAISTVQVPCHS